MMLQALQNLLAGIYDVPLSHDVDEFLLTDRSRLPPALRASGIGPGNRAGRNRQIQRLRRHAP